MTAEFGDASGPNENKVRSRYPVFAATAIHQLGVGRTTLCSAEVCTPEALLPVPLKRAWSPARKVCLICHQRHLISAILTMSDLGVFAKMYLLDA